MVLNDQIRQHIEGSCGTFVKGMVLDVICGLPEKLHSAFTLMAVANKPQDTDK
jgi:hypothetical protein